MLTRSTLLYALFILGAILCQLLSWPWFRSLLKRIPALNPHLRKRPKPLARVGWRSLSWLLGWYGWVGLISPWLVAQFFPDALALTDLATPDGASDSLQSMLGLTGVAALGLASLGYYAAQQLARPIHLSWIPGDRPSQRQSKPPSASLLALSLRWWGFVLAVYASLAWLMEVILFAGIRWDVCRQAIAFAIIVFCLAWPLVSLLKLRQRMQSPRVRAHFYGLVMHVSVISIVAIAAFYLLLYQAPMLAMMHLYRPSIWIGAIALHSLWLGLYVLIPAPKKPRRRRRRRGPTVSVPADIDSTD